MLPKCHELLPPLLGHRVVRVQQPQGGAYHAQGYMLSSSAACMAR
jgi:hypothetical protein